MPTPRGERRRKRRAAAREEECSGGWPQERIRHETRPVGSERMKAPRGCDNLKAQAVGRGRSGQRSRCSGWKNAEGVRNHKGGAAEWHSACLGVGRWETSCPMRRLGAWATSGEEPKPMRGTWELFKFFLGTWCVKTLWPSRQGEGREGSAEPVGALATSGLKLCRVWQPHEREGPMR